VGLAFFVDEDGEVQMPERKMLGELLMERGLIDEIQLRSAVGYQKNWGGKLGSTLVEMGFVSPEEIAKALEEQLRLKCLQESQMVPDPEATALMSAEDAAKYTAFPLRVRGNEVMIALSNPLDLAVTDEIGFKLGKRVRGVLAMESAIKNSIKKYYGGSGGRDYKVDMNAAGPEDGPEIMHFDKGSGHNAMDVLETPFNAGFQDGLKIDLRPETKEEALHPLTMEDPLAGALASILVEKGIITKEELQARLEVLKKTDWNSKKS
jgi:MshEN domain